jgi:phage shock protein PspC (stress-responsive transcriptional regulator)
MSNNPPDYPSAGPEQPSEPTDPFATPPPLSDDLGGAGEPGPPLPPPPVARQLVRDPFTKLGGVASGLSHHYGIDVSLIRLAFVFFTFVTGFGIVFYALAWIIIPRARFWPPVGDRRPSKQLSTREIGIGLLLLGALIALFVNGGTFSQILAPLLLIGGGLWLLAQTPTPVTSDVPPPPTAPLPPVDPVGPTSGAIPTGSPVPPRSGRRKAAVLGFIGLLLFFPVLVIGALITAAVFGNLDFEADPGASYTYEPATVELLPESIERDEGKILLDLTQLDGATFDEPTEVDVNLGFGEIEVVIPEGMAVEVDADAGLGSVTVFDRNDDGVRPSITNVTAEADVILDLHVDVGEVRVELADQ